MSKIGVVIGNLGTPQSPQVKDVRAYLKQFLMDPTVIDKPVWFRAALVYGIIAPFRSPVSAKAYQSIWTDEGSPLLVYSQKLVKKLQQELGDDFCVTLGMRYGQPSIEQAILDVKGCSQILLFPQYPQYAESSTKTWFDEAEKMVRKHGLSADILSISSFYDAEEFLSSLSQLVERSLRGRSYDHLLMSYHGLPENHLKKIDPSHSHCLQKADCCERITANNELCYRAHCYFVSRQLAQRLNIKSYSVSFQSRLGREPWISPFTDHVIKELPSRGIRRLAVVMPSFTVDCLETLEEIHERAKNDFLQAGGEEFYAISCLNDDDFWVQQLTKLIHRTILKNTSGGNV